MVYFVSAPRLGLTVIAVAIATTAIIHPAVKLVQEWLTATDVPATVEDVAINVHDTVNNDPTDINTATAPQDSVQNHVPFAGRIGRECRNKFAFKERSGANYLVAHKWIYDQLTSRGVRPAHISKILPLAIEVAFVPTDAEIAAAQYRVSSDTRRRLELGHTNWTGLSLWSRLFGGGVAATAAALH